ncbi:hypothetical protein TNCV_657051 [Trichonephila clavipes]|nr:hypothetical protein TNCV_657051 [Trichonephila clavipes]
MYLFRETTVHRILCLGHNSIDSWRQKAVATEINYVTVPRKSHGGSTNLSVTLLGMPSSQQVGIPSIKARCLPHVRRKEIMDTVQQKCPFYK